MIPTVHNGMELRVAAIRQHVTIFDIFERMGLDVLPETQQMKCPFHVDNNPSARVFADQNKVYCWTCQKSWDVIAAVEEHWKLRFPDAVVWLEQEFAIPGATQGLTAVVRTQLSSRATPDVSQAAVMVEQALQGRKMRLGFERYTRCLMALDLTVYESQQKRIKPDEVQRRLQVILQAARVD